jgi:hypothetical protein
MVKWVAVSAAILFASQASEMVAALVTSVGETSPNSRVIDLAQFAGEELVVREAMAIDSFSDEDIILRPGTNGFPRIYDGPWGLGNNGVWNQGREGFIGSVGPDHLVSLRIEFDRNLPVSEIGVLLNYSPGFLPTIMSALGDDFGVLEQYTIDEAAPISTPGQVNKGEFRGFNRGTNDIRAIHFSGSFFVIDDIRFFRSVAQPGDANGDGRVDIDDLNNVRNHFGTGSGIDRSGIPGDTVPFDGLVNIDDVNNVRNHFGSTLAAAVPEPASVVAALLSALLLSLTRSSHCRYPHDMAICGPRNRADRRHRCRG